MLSRNLTRSVAAAGAVAVAIGAFALGSSNFNNDASGTATAAQAPAAGRAPQFGQVPQNWSPGTGTIITGAAADKAEAAALAAGYSGTPNRVLKLSDGSYAVHMFATSGPHHIFVNSDFKVTGAATGG